jgi:cephalosporin-C deacetylase
MPLFDLPLQELRAYRAERPAPPDLDEFWADTLADARSHDLAATFIPVDNGLSLIETLDVTFAGFGGAPIRGWLHLPARREEPLPCVVEYLGYGGGRGLAHERVLWAAAGYAHLVMDSRGQGSGWSVGVTPDPGASGDPAQPGCLTQGILDPATYYYRRLITDAVRAIEAVRAHPAVDATRVAVTGHSQGGGLTIAAASLVPDVVTAMPDAPFLCDFPRAITLVDGHAYTEIARYLKVHRDHVERVLATLAYFDGVVLGTRACSPALFSVGLMDESCPPSTVYAAFNSYAGPKEIVEYPFNGHEGGGCHHDAAKLHWLARRAGDSTSAKGRAGR